MQVQEGGYAFPIAREVHGARVAMEGNAQLSQGRGSKEGRGPLPDKGSVRREAYPVTLSAGQREEVAKEGMEQGFALEVEIELAFEAAKP